MTPAQGDSAVLDTHYQHINSLVAEAKSGNGDALAGLHTFYQPLIKASVKRCVSREPRLTHHREDLDGEIYGILSDLVRLYDPKLSYFSYYLSTRLDHAIMSRARKVFLRQNSAGHGIEEISFSDMSESWEPEGQSDPFGRMENDQAIHEALGHLKPGQRDAVQAYFFDDYTQAEAAGLLGITQASFCKRLQRALTRLKELLVDGLD